jgi:ribonuclease D
VTGPESATQTPGHEPEQPRRRTRPRRNRPQQEQQASAEESGTAPQTSADDAPPAPLLRLRDPLPEVIDTPTALDEAIARVAAGSGPVALDAERASGYRYSARAYLIQLRREGAGTLLIDPVPFPDLHALDEAIGDAEWILHAATQDLGCLREVGLRPRRLFDTELAARLLGYPRVGLATLTETILGLSMRKEHSAADWSRRPLPKPWLEYAALDVEALVELRDRLATELEDTGKRGWAEEEFTWLLDFTPTVRQDPWRRTSGIHRLRSRRSIAAVRELWQARDGLAERRDVTPGRLLPDSAIIAAARKLPASTGALLGTEGFHGRAARGHADLWLAALDRARALPDSELPTHGARGDGPPQMRSWADRDPLAAARLAAARAAIAERAEELNVPVENMLTPDYMRRVLWTPPHASADEMETAVAGSLAKLGARAWQIELTGPLITRAILTATVPDETDEDQ